MATLTLVSANDTACAEHEQRMIEEHKEALKVKALEIKRQEADNNTKTALWYKPAVNIGNNHPTYQDNEKTGFDKELDLVFGLDYRLKNSCYRNLEDEKSLPVRKQYIYAVSDNIPLYVQYPNNCINLIQDSNWLHYNLQRQHKTNYDITDGRGIYVIDYYRMSHISQQLHGASPDEPYHRLMRFYSETDIILTNDKVVNEAFKDCMARKAEYDRNYVRIITFIPLDKVLDNNVVFVPALGLVFGTGSIFTGRIHPYSDNYYNFRDQSRPSTSNYVAIDIVDNENNDVYFTKVGNKVVRLNSTADKTRHDGVRVEVYQNNIKESSEEAELCDIEKLGVYKSRTKAEYNGDTEHISKLVEIRKIEKDLKVSENELKRVDMEDELKRKTHNYKLNELEVSMDKVRLDMAKTQLDMEAVKLDFIYKVKEYVLKQIANRGELKFKIEKFNLELERDAYKAYYEKSKFNTDMITLGATTIAKLVKFL